MTTRSAPLRKASPLLDVLLAIVMVTGMIPLAPPASAQGPEDVSIGEIEPGDCLTLETDPEALLENLPSDPDEARNDTNETLNESPSPERVLAEDKTVPTLCGIPQNDTLNRGLHEVLQAANDGIRRVNDALDAMENHTPTVEREDRIPFLEEPFTRERVGGLGDWDVRSSADNTGFRQPVDPRVADGYALTDAPGEGYEHGMRSTLVSPTVDLGGVALDPFLATVPQQAEAALEDRLPQHLPVFTSENEESGTDLDVCLSTGQSDEETCAFRGPLGSTAQGELYEPLREAYLDTARDAAEAWAREMGAATLEIRHRYNLADGLDGVRYEVLTEAPPPRGLPAAGEPIEPIDEDSEMSETGAFQGEEAFTGASDGWKTARFDVSRWAGERIWIVAHARTASAFGIPDFFQEPTLFPDGSENAGYQLSGVHVNGTAHAENLRVLDIDAGQAPLDGTPTVPPPLDQRTVTVAVTNQGQETDEATVELEQCRHGACQSTDLGQVTMEPGEIETLETRFPDPSPVSGELTLTATATPPGQDEPSDMDGAPEDNELSKTLALERVQEVTVHEAPNGMGLTVEPDRADAQEPRTVTLEVENTGNVPATGTVELSLTDAREGTDRTDWLDGTTQRSLSLEPNAQRSLSWQLTPPEGAMLEAQATLKTGARVTGATPATAHVYIERTPGLVCQDDFDRSRSCGSQWERFGTTPVDPDDVDVVDATVDEAGSAYLLTDGEDVFVHDGVEAREIGEADDAQWLATTREGVRAVGDEGELYRVTETSVDAHEEQIPLEEVEAVSVTSDGRLVAAGSTEEDRLAVALERDTLGFEAFTSPPEMLPEGTLEATSVMEADGALALSVRHTTPGTSEDPRKAWALLCNVEPSVSTAPVNCLGSHDGGAEDPLRIRVPLLAGDEDPTLSLASVNETPVLVVESPFPETVPGDSFEDPDEVGFDDVSVGDLHACAFNATASDVSCWGDDSEGQASPPDGLGSVAAVTAGGLHTCALSDTDEVTCWGDDSEGQATPPSSEWNSVAAVTAGGEHACALESNDEVTCWGDNVGDESDWPDSNVDSVSAGGEHACAVVEETVQRDNFDDTTTTNVTCWGRFTEDFTNKTLNVSAVSAGGDFACAVLSEASNVTCWGGDADDHESDWPDSNVDSVSAGGEHACAVLNDASAECWGQNTYGQVVEHAESVDDVAAGERATCLLYTNGTVECFGGGHGDQPRPCEQEDGDSWTLGTYCLYQVNPLAEDPADAIDPLGEGLLDAPDLQVEAAAGQTWLFEPSAPSGEPSLERLVDTGRGIERRSVLGLPSEPVHALGGSGDQALAVGQDRLFRFGTGAGGVSFAAGDWQEYEGLEPISGGVALHWQEESEFRGVCGEGNGQVVGGGSGALPASASVCLGVDSSGEEFEDVNLTMRYAIEELGSGPVEVRALVSPVATSVGPRGVDAGAAARGAYEEVENQAQPPWSAAGVQGDPEALWQDQLGVPGVEYPVRGGVDEGDRFDELDTERRYASRVVLDRFWSPTPLAWQEQTWDVKEGMAELAARWGQADLLGVEVWIPGEVEMAVDSVWLNATTEGEEGEGWNEELILRHNGDSDSAKGLWSGVDEGMDDPFSLGDTGGWKSSPISSDGSGLVFDGEGGAPIASPAVDLREASSPVLTIDHAYAATDKDAWQGTVLAQVEQAPGEWSSWFELAPEGGYPTTPWTEDYDRFHGTNLDGHGLEVGGISSDVETQVLNPANHDRHSFDLLDQEQPLAGETVRFGLETTSHDAYWAVSNVRVLADARPSVDLGLEGAHMEGYNASETGLPPGTHASLNATLANHGDVNLEQARVSWELVGVGKTEGPLASGATPVSGLSAGEETWTTIPVTIPESLDDDVVFADDPFGYLRVTVDRVEPTDEDPSNNDAQIGSYLHPVPLQETRSFELGVDVTPEEGSPQATRTVRLVLENTGNVPLEGVTVERTILESTATGPQPVPGETVTVETEHPVPPGAQRPVAVLAPDLGQDDRRFTPGNTGSFEVIATASLGGDEKTVQTTVTAEDTLLQANAQQPATGLATDGTVQPEDGWRVDGPGVFGAPNAWHLDLEGAGDDGEPQTHVLDLPEVDLSTAEDPRLSLFQKYDFEDGFDGARLEASLDGGDTWQPVPTADDQPPSGYGEVLGGNPLAGDQVRTPAFTGSTQGEGFDGWVQTTFDLAQIPELVEPGERELPMGFLEGKSRVEVDAPPNERGLERAYTHPSWQGGSEDPENAFLVENVSRPLPKDEYGGGDEFLYADEGQFCAEFDPRNQVFPLEKNRKAAVEWWYWPDTQSMPYHGTSDDKTNDWWPDSTELHREELWNHSRIDLDQQRDAWAVDISASDMAWDDDVGPMPVAALDGLRVFSYVPHPSPNHTTFELGKNVAWDEEWGQLGNICPSVNPVEEAIPEQDDERGANIWRILEVERQEGSFNAFSTAPRIFIPPGREDLRTQEGFGDQMFDSPSYFNARLVTPAIDLRGADQNIGFSFDHVPAFQTVNRGGTTETESGGVVQISVKDPVTKEWGSWKQIYQKPGQVNNFTRVNPGTDDNYTQDFTGGYEAKRMVHNGPFQNHPQDPVSEDEQPGDPPFYVGSSADDLDRGAPGGEYYFNHCYQVDMDVGDSPYEGCSREPVPWKNATFPLDQFSGETIRLAFHAHKIPSCSFDHAYRIDAGSTSQWRNCPHKGQRWLIANLTTQQPVFTGQPVDLRLVAGTDGSVDEAHWAVDEIEITADQYANNVGLHVDEDPDPVGPGQTTTLTGEIRNHGTQTRTDLAVRANLDHVQGEVTVDVDAEAPARGERDVATPTFTLEPGESRAFTVTLDRSPFDIDNGTGQLTLDAVQWNEAVNRFTLVPNDEIPSNLQHEASVDLLGPDPLLGDVELSPSRVEPGQTAAITVNATNPTTEPERVRLDCTVQRVQAHDPVNRRQNDEPVPLYAPPVPCTRAGNAEVTVQAVTLDPGTTQLTLQTTPPQGGAYDVRLELTPHDEPGRVLGAHETRLFSGDEPLVHFADFETPNGTAGQPDGWRVFGQESLGFSQQRAARGNFSARLGIPDAAYDQDNNYATQSVTHLATPPIDLRNVTEGDAALTAYHMARFAYGDGGLVQARVLADEANNQWTHPVQNPKWEPLEPVDGYDGHVTSYHVNVGDPTDPNQPPPPSDCRGTGGGVGDPTNPAGVLRGGPGAGDPSGNNPHPDYNPALVKDEEVNDQGNDWVHSKGFYTENGYFGSPNDEAGFTPRWEDDWTRSTFPLTDPETGEPVTVTDQQGSSGEEFELLGHVVQFAFTLYTGRADDSDPTAREVQMGCTDPDPLERGRGQGWFVDSVAVAATNLTAQPTSMRTPMTDNATKTLPIRLDNAGPTAEHVEPAIDHDRSSTTRQQAWTEEQRTVPAHGDAITNVTTRFDRSPFSLPFEHVVRVEPEEKLNPNSLAETELTLDFDPRTWPDLSVTMLEPDRSPIEGTPVLVPVEIENHGQDRSPSTTLAFTAHHDNGTVNETVSIPSLPPATEDPARATTTAFVSWTPPRGTAGTHELTVEADPEGLVPQYTTSDDADQQRVTVHPLRLANLDVEADDLTVTAQQTQPHLDEQGPVRTYTVPAGTLTTVNVPVTNRGNAPAQDIDVRLALGPTVLPAERIPHLDPGQTREVSFSFRAQEGTHELTLEASSATRDADPSTNRAPRDATIRLQAVDFHVDVDAPETLTLEPGQPTPATIEVTNQGTLGTLVDVTATAPEHATLELDRTQVFLQPSDNVTLDATATLAPDAPGGDHPVHVAVADADDPASVTTRELTLHHPPTHDTAVALETTQLPPGPGTLTATLANGGNLAETLTVNATLAGQDVTTQPPTVTVPRGQDAIAKIPVRVPATLEPGTHEVALSLEGTHQDTHEATVDVEATPRAALEPDPEQPPRFDTDGLTLPVRIHNQGNQPLDGSLAVDPTLDARTTPRDVALDAGEATTATVHLAEWTGDESVPLTLRGDEADATLDVPLPRERPDLRILEQRLDKAPPDSDGTSQLEITVGNPSSAHAHDVPVGVYLDGQLADRRTIDTVEPDASHTLTIEWPPFDEPHTLTVDAGHAFGLPDEDPSDNAVSLAVGDEEPAVFARIVEDLRGVPAPSVPMLLVAAAILSRFLVKPSERES